MIHFVWGGYFFLVLVGQKGGRHAGTQKCLVGTPRGVGKKEPAPVFSIPGMHSVLPLFLLCHRPRHHTGQPGVRRAQPAVCMPAHEPRRGRPRHHFGTTIYPIFRDEPMGLSGLYCNGGRIKFSNCEFIGRDRLAAFNHSTKRFTILWFKHLCTCPPSLRIIDVPSPKKMPIIANMALSITW